jgi:hypothetical protein
MSDSSKDTVFNDLSAKDISMCVSCRMGKVRKVLVLSNPHVTALILEVCVQHGFHRAVRWCLQGSHMGVTCMSQHCDMWILAAGDKFQ